MLPSVPGPSEASSSEAAYPGERARVDGGGAGSGAAPRVLPSLWQHHPSGQGGEAGFISRDFVPFSA